MNIPLITSNNNKSNQFIEPPPDFLGGVCETSLTATELALLLAIVSLDDASLDATALDVVAFDDEVDAPAESLEVELDVDAIAEASELDAAELGNTMTGVDDPVLEVIELTAAEVCDEALEELTTTALLLELIWLEVLELLMAELLMAELLLPAAPQVGFAEAVSAASPVCLIRKPNAGVANVMPSEKLTRVSVQVKL